MSDLRVTRRRERERERDMNDIYMSVCVCIYGQKVDPAGVCFGWVVLALSGQQLIFLKTKKADPKHCENWRRESGSEFHKNPQCASEVSGENSCEILSLKV